MTELRRTTVPKATVPRVKVGLALVIAALTLLLTACPGPGTDPVVKPEITLSVDKPTLSDGGGEVILTAEVTKGEVTLVTFKRDKGGTIESVTTPNADGDFVTPPLTVTETTTFTATATGPGGTTSDAETVTVTPSTETPVAPSQTFKTYKEIALLYGITPTGFSATSTVTVQGIKGDVTAATDKTTARGGKVSIVAAKDALAFDYRPASDFVGTDSFEYSVSVNGKTATGTITVTVGDLPVDIFKISTLSDLNSTEANQTVIVTKEIPCSTNPCIRLLEGQTLTGKVVTSDGITILSPTASIKANIPGTRQPGTASGQGAETRVIELADGSSVKNLTINGEGSRYFVAIFGAVFDGGSGFLEEDITIEDVIIKNSNGKPIYFDCKSFPCDTTIDYGAYNLTINNLSVESAFDTLVIGVPGRLTFTNSFIDLRQPTVGNMDFGDNVGIDVLDLLGASLTIDNVDVFMESTKYNLDNGGENFNATPFIIKNQKTATTTTLTVKNCDVTFGQILTQSGAVYSFKVGAENSSSINIVDSVNNNSVQDASYSGDVEGAIQFN